MIFYSNLKPTSFSIVEESNKPLIFESGAVEIRNKLVGYDMCQIEFEFDEIEYSMFQNFLEEINYVEHFQADFINIGELREYVILGDISQAQNDVLFTVSFNLMRKRVECSEVDQKIIENLKDMEEILKGNSVSRYSKMQCSSTNINFIRSLNEYSNNLSYNKNYSEFADKDCTYTNKMILANLRDYSDILKLTNYEKVDENKQCTVLNQNFIAYLDGQKETLKIVGFNSDNDGATENCRQVNIDLIANLDLAKDVISETQIAQNDNIVDATALATDKVKMYLNTDKSGGCADVDVMLLSVLELSKQIISETQVSQDQVVVNNIIDAAEKNIMEVE